MLGSVNRTLMEKTSPLEPLGRELHKTKNILKAIYDFATLGGAVGDIALIDDDGKPAVIPAKSVITRVWSETITGVTSLGAATVAGKWLTAADLQVATAKADLVAAALIEGVPDGTAAKFIKGSSSDVVVKATVAVAALTAGRVLYYIEYVLSE